MELVQFVAVFAAVLWATSLMSVIVWSAVCISARLHVKKICLGSGPTLYKGTWRRMPFTIGVLPMANLEISGMGYSEDNEVEVPAGQRLFSDAPNYVQALIFILPSLGTVALIAAILGLSDTMDHIVSGLRQLLLGALSPFNTGAGLVSAWTEVMRSQGVVVAAAVLASKVVAAEILPLLSPNLFRSTAALFGLAQSRRVTITVNVMMLLGLVFGASWVLAIITYLVT